jgi:hypothetical protein
MLGFFPTLYPGELLYSAIARYQVRSGNLSPKLTIEELFNSRSITATADLPCGLDNLVKNLPPHSSIVTPYLPTLSKLGILQGEAENRAESDQNCTGHCG